MVSVRSSIHIQAPHFLWKQHARHPSSSTSWKSQALTQWALGPHPPSGESRFRLTVLDDFLTSVSLVPFSAFFPFCLLFFSTPFSAPPSLPPPSSHHSPASPPQAPLPSLPSRPPPPSSPGKFRSALGVSVSGPVIMGGACSWGAWKLFWSVRVYEYQAC